MCFILLGFKKKKRRATLLNAFLQQHTEDLIKWGFKNLQILYMLSMSFPKRAFVTSITERLLLRRLPIC
jgi:hypothetical protein